MFSCDFLGNAKWKEAKRDLVDTLARSVQTATWKGYFKKGDKYLKWCKERGVEGKCGNEVVIAAYIAFLGKSRLWGGIRTELEGLKGWFRLVGVPFDPKSELVKRAFLGVKKTQLGRVTKKKPIRITWLKKMGGEKRGRLGKRNMTLMLVGFFALLRVSELMTLRWKDVVFKRKGMVLKIRRAKGASEREKWPILFNKDRRICAVRWLKEWKGLTDSKDKDFLFPGRMGSHLGFGSARRIIKKELGILGRREGKYSSHSLRRGGAQFLDLQHGTMREQQGLGGWRSDTAPHEYLGTKWGSKLDAATKMANH
jgi:integrase